MPDAIQEFINQIATLETLRLLHFDNLAELIAESLMSPGHVFLALGLVIFGIGLYIANGSHKRCG